MGVHLGIPQGGRHPVDQRVRDRVFQPLGLLVHAVPIVPEPGDEVCLQHPVAAHHPNRQPPALPGKLDSFIWLVFDQSLLRQPLDHPAHRRRRQLELMRNIVGSRRLPPLRKEIDGLEVILDRSRQGFLSECGGGHKRLLELVEPNFDMQQN
jgi:hypothetical protein